MGLALPMKVERHVSYRNPPDGEKGGTIRRPRRRRVRWHLDAGYVGQRRPAHLLLICCSSPCTTTIVDSRCAVLQGPARAAEPEQRLGLRRLRGGWDPTRPRERPHSTARATK